MPAPLLPASAAAFAPRSSSVNIVLGAEIELWLKETLKRVNKDKKPLNSVQQCQKYLTDILSAKDAIWTLASLIVPRFPETGMPTNPTEHLLANQLIHIKAYVVHVDMVLRNEVTYKLTSDTIATLVEYHDKVYMVNAKACTPKWSNTNQQAKIHEDYHQAINEFVFRTHVSALEGLEEDGAGELLAGKSDKVKITLLNLWKPLVAPPPLMVEVIRQPTLLPSSPVNNNMWATHPQNLPTVEPWRMFSSSPSVAYYMSPEMNQTPVWGNTNMAEMQLPSPPMSMVHPQSTSGYFYSTAPVTEPTPTLPLPSMFVPYQCGASLGMATTFGSQQNQSFSTPIM